MPRLRLLPLLLALSIILTPTIALPLSNGCGDCNYDPTIDQTDCSSDGTNWANCTAGTYCERDANGHMHCYATCFGQRCLWT